MPDRRSFIQTAALAGIAGIIASRKAPAFAQDMKLLKIGQLGQGSHSFAARFRNPGDKYKVGCRPYIVWDDAPGVSQKMKERNGYERVAKSRKNWPGNATWSTWSTPIIARASHSPVRDWRWASRPSSIVLSLASIADAEEIVRLAKEHNAPLMQGSSLEYQPILPEIARFAREKGPVRSYDNYCPEPFFPWMFPHTLNFAHAALGGGIDSAFFTGDFVMDWGDFKDGHRFRGEESPVLRSEASLWRGGEPAHLQAPRGTAPDHRHEPGRRRSGKLSSHRVRRTGNENVCCRGGIERPQHLRAHVPDTQRFLREPPYPAPLRGHPRTAPCARCHREVPPRRPEKRSVWTS